LHTNTLTSVAERSNASKLVAGAERVLEAPAFADPLPEP